MFDNMLAELIALGQVVFIDLVLAGDNAIVVGVAAAGVPRDKRARVITIGIGAAVVLRIIFALMTTQLLDIVGLTLAGGLLLAWVCWKLWSELREHDREAAAHAADGGGAATATPSDENVAKSMRSAIWSIVLADVSMSLDNVLAVAGAAREHLWVLVIGLLLSVGLMGAAASFIARLLNRYRWIAYVGLAVIAYVAVRMIWEGSEQVAEALALWPH